MKYSRQREVIFSALQNELHHPTADAVYSHVRRDLPSISLGTVYRNLNLLVEQGELRKISTPISGDKFDARLQTHHHIICKSCGRVADVEENSLAELANGALEIAGFKVLEKQVVLSGICADCQEKEGFSEEK